MRQARGDRVPTRTSDAPELADRYSRDNGTNSPVTTESTISTRKTAIPAVFRRGRAGCAPGELRRRPSDHDARLPDRVKNPPG
ncbi:hypothetical protein [Streptomyces sp. Ag109_O5-1]|uniref:hypothetical protein n=1 Tax=Streptomyces sp. Ag109_O5-1 TaxID=1938851 RepID=UPI000F4E6E5B|nr:hypothetical protein [Streptomyces sp. Ag109_O5-1]